MNTPADIPTSPNRAPAGPGAPSWSLYLVAQKPLPGSLERLLDIVGRAVAGGVGVVQLRAKDAGGRLFLEEARAVARLLEGRGVPFVVNDRVDVAALVPGAGVHLGQDDLPVAEARKLLGPGRLVGVSAHTPEEARQAERDGADYLGAGPAFPTRTKTDTAPPQTAESFRRITSAVSLPVVAIGGIDAGNVQTLRGLGLAGVAVSSAICLSPDPAAAARAVRAAMGAF